jgi:hypothetical protein
MTEHPRRPEPFEQEGAAATSLSTTASTMPAMSSSATAASTMTRRTSSTATIAVSVTPCAHRPALMGGRHDPRPRRAGHHSC